jgi:hypothetical protein
MHNITLARWGRNRCDWEGCGTYRAACYSSTRQCTAPLSSSTPCVGGPPSAPERDNKRRSGPTDHRFIAIFSRNSSCQRAVGIQSFACSHVSVPVLPCLLAFLEGSVPGGHAGNTGPGTAVNQVALLGAKRQEKLISSPKYGSVFEGYALSLTVLVWRPVVNALSGMCALVWLPPSHVVLCSTSVERVQAVPVLETLA